MMSLTASTKLYTVIRADNITKEDGPFYCSFCKNKMMLKKGMVKVHHFAHFPNSNCPYAEGESEMHYQAKISLYNAACERNIKAELEKVLSPQVRADVLLTFNSGKQFAVEFQKSKLTREKVISRLRNYENTKIPVIWIFFMKEPLQQNEIKLSDMEKYFHEQSKGLFYFTGSNEVITYSSGDFECNNIYLYQHCIGLYDLLNEESFIQYDLWWIPKALYNLIKDREEKERLWQEKLEKQEYLAEQERLRQEHLKQIRIKEMTNPKLIKPIRQKEKLELWIKERIEDTDDDLTSIINDIEQDYPVHFNSDAVEEAMVFVENYMKSYPSISYTKLKSLMNLCYITCGKQRLTSEMEHYLQRNNSLKFLMEFSPNHSAVPMDLYRKLASESIYCIMI